MKKKLKELKVYLNPEDTTTEEKQDMLLDLYSTIDLEDCKDLDEFNELVVAYIPDDTLIEELEVRGYTVTK